MKKWLLFTIPLLFLISISFKILEGSKVDPKVDMPYVIGVSQANLLEPWRIIMNEEIMEEAKGYDNVKLVFMDAAMSTDKQIQDVERLMGYGIDLLIISPNDAKSLTPIVSACYEKVPVIVLDRAIQGYDYTLYIGPDNEQIGKQAGRLVVELLGERGGNVLVLQGLEDSPPVVGRNTGFHQVISRYSAIQVLETINGDWMRDTAEDRLLELEDIEAVDIIFAHNDDMAFGAYRALEKLGLTDTKIIGVDGLEGEFGGRELVQQEKIAGTFTCPTGGKEAMWYAMNILNKERGIPKKIILRSVGITSNNYAKKDDIDVSRDDEGTKPVLGFIQVGSESKWRIANSNSIKTAALQENIDLRFVNAQQSQERQIQAMEEFIEEGVDVIAMSPVVAKGWEDILRKAQKAGIPVIMSDRSVEVEDDDLYTTFIGADFQEEGRRAARWMIQDIGQPMRANVVELRGTTGADPVIGRASGFRQIIDEYDDVTIISQRVGDFTVDGGQLVMEALLQQYLGDIDYVYAHNDDMAIGAIQAIKDVGLEPGKDIKIVSIDGTKEAFQAMFKGELNCSVECSPLLGPVLMKAVKDVTYGKELPLKIITEEDVFTIQNARHYAQGREY